MAGRWLASGWKRGGSTVSRHCVHVSGQQRRVGTLDQLPGAASLFILCMLALSPLSSPLFLFRMLATPVPLLCCGVRACGVWRLHVLLPVLLACRCVRMDAVAACTLARMHPQWAQPSHKHRVAVFGWVVDERLGTFLSLSQVCGM